MQKQTLGRTLQRKAYRFTKRAVKLVDVNGAPTWHLAAGKGREIDLREPRYTLAFLEASDPQTANLVEGRRAFVQRFGLMNGELVQSDAEVFDIMCKIGQLVSAMQATGLAQGFSPAAQARMPVPLSDSFEFTLGDAAAWANDAIQRLNLQCRFMQEPPAIGISFAGAPTLEHALWGQALDFMHEASRRVVDVRVCGHCRTIFAPANKRQVFCSSSCRVLRGKALQEALQENEQRKLQDRGFKNDPEA